MENSEALRIVRALVDGLNPSTAGTCKPEWLLQQPQTIRALEEVVRALQSEVERVDRKRPLPPNVGEPWLPPEEEQLCAEFDRGMSTREIAKVHGRLPGGVMARLGMLGKIPCQVAMNFSCPSADAGGSAKRPSQGTAAEGAVIQDLAVDPHRPWLPEEDARMCAEFSRHVDLGQIGQYLGRSRLAVYSRLVCLGKIRRKCQSSAA